MNKIAIRKFKNLTSIISNIPISSFKNLRTKQKIYLGIALFLFVLQFFMGGDTLYKGTDTNYISIFSIIGLLIAVIRRVKTTRFMDEKSVFNIIFNDYDLSSYVSLSLLSIIYTILQGLILGTGLGLVSYALGCLFYGSIDLFIINIAGFFICLIFIFSTRLVFEFISLIFKVAEDISTINKIPSKSN